MPRCVLTPPFPLQCLHLGRRAHLKLILTSEDEEGGEILSECDAGFTMGMAGAVADSKFVLVMDGE